MFMDFWDAIFSQFSGFVLWLLVFPLRVVVGLLDPVFSPVTALFDFSAFMDGLQVLRGFFDDVNWFIPFYALVGIIEVTFVAMLVLLCINAFAATTLGEFVSVSRSFLVNVVENAIDDIKQLLMRIAFFFLGR